MSEPNKTTIEYVKRWMQAEGKVESLRHQLSAAEEALAAARNELGAFVCPADASCFERFTFWIQGESVGLRKGELLLVASREHATSDPPAYAIKWRDSPRACNDPDKGESK